MKKIIENIFFILFCLAILALSIRGIAGNPNEDSLNQAIWKEKGPLELSPERGRFALTYSLLENKSLYFSEKIARFATPDLGFINGKYVSLFAPGVSFFAIPGYIIGKKFGFSQVGAYSIISIFALINACLVKKIAERLGANRASAQIAALIFLFATPSFSYAVSFFQHHLSSFFILFSLLLLLTKSKFWSLFFVWFAWGTSFIVDYPNAFLMLPIVAYSLSFLFDVFRQKHHFLRVRVNLKKAFAILALIPPLFLLLGFNKLSYGSYFQLSGTVGTIKELKDSGIHNLPVSPAKESSGEINFGLTYFKTRNIINGFYTLIFSPDRGVLYYTPVLLLALIGFLEFGEKRKKIKVLLGSIILFNLLLYSMWGDPWGGWAFGSRYLVPSYAICSIFISLALTRLRKDTIFMLIILLSTSFSVLVNTLGALTTSANPPRVEASSLYLLSGVNEKYTFERNLDFLLDHGSKSFVYGKYFKNLIPPWQYYLVVTLSIISFVALNLLRLLFYPRRTTFELVLTGKRTGFDFKLGFRVFERIKFLFRSFLVTER